MKVSRQIDQDVRSVERGHFYRGHRADSFFPEDVNEIVELRARQRTFEGAYGRSALLCLGYALTILRLFDPSFARIGIAYTVLAFFLFVLAFLRGRQARHDFADQHRNQTWEHAIPTVGQHGKTNYGRPFRTARVRRRCLCRSLPCSACHAHGFA